jgi:hypothetical protein
MDDNNFIVFGNCGLLSNLIGLAKPGTLLIDITEDDESESESEQSQEITEKKSTDEYSVVEYIIVYLTTIQLMHPTRFA